MRTVMDLGLESCNSSLHQEAFFNEEHAVVSILSQHGPMMFFHRTNCSKRAVFVPKTWENVSPMKSTGKVESAQSLADFWEIKSIHIHTAVRIHQLKIIRFFWDIR